MMKGLKYVNHDIVFQEYPDEVTLAINLSRCPNHCPGCHSSFLCEDVGEPLTTSLLLALADSYQGEITCIGLQGGDNDPEALCRLAADVKEAQPSLHVGWYSGRSQLPEMEGGFPLHLFDYIKLGPWREQYGPLSSPTTNQRFFRINHASEGHTLEDCTHRFRKK